MLRQLQRCKPSVEVGSLIQLSIQSIVVCDPTDRNDRIIASDVCRSSEQDLEQNSFRRSFFRSLQQTGSWQTKASEK